MTVAQTTFYSLLFYALKLGLPVMTYLTLQVSCCQNTSRPFMHHWLYAVVVPMSWWESWQPKHLNTVFLFTYANLLCEYSSAEKW